MNKRIHYPAEFKAKVVLEILPEGLTVNQIAAKYGFSPVVLPRWKKEFWNELPKSSRKGVRFPKRNSNRERSILQNLSAKSANSVTSWTGLKKSEQILGPDWKKKSR